MAYFDYAANAPVLKEVIEEYSKVALEYYGNPNSNHELGRKSMRKIEEDSKTILELLNCPNYEIIYTSGATEANNLAIKGMAERYKSKGKHIIIGAFEHNSLVSSCTRLVESGFELDVVGVLKNGLIDLDELKAKIRPDTIIVSIAAADGELGIRQPIEEIGKMLKEYPNIHFHVDASQCIGKSKIAFEDVDCFTLTPHKFYGLNSFGALIKKKELGLRIQMDGGKSTTIFRSGTPDVAMIAALRKALEMAILKQEEHYNYVLNLNHKLLEFLKGYDSVHLNSVEASLPYLVNISILNQRGNDLVSKLEAKEIYVSAKTSCCPIETPSKHVLALTHDKKLASSTLRISLSHLTIIDELDELMQALKEVLEDHNG